MGSHRSGARRRAGSGPLPLIPRSPQRARAARAAPALLLLPFLALAGVGCDRGAGAPRLVSARALDERTPDGDLTAGESVHLAFDRPLALRAPTRSGLRLHPPGASAGAYQIHPGTDGRSLWVELGPGEIALVAAGLHGDPAAPRATGISLELDRIEGLTDENGRPLRGETAVVDLEPVAARAATLERAEWQDRDRSFTVSRGDTLELVFDRDVWPAPTIRQQGSTVPADLLILPVAEDRLDDGRSRSTFAPALGFTPSATIVLGSSPRLTVQGTFGSESVRFAGSASGIAIDGTPIRPHFGLHERRGAGVASLGAIDIGGECSPFLPAPHAFPHAGELVGHTATALPDGRVIIAGGWRRTPGAGTAERTVTDEVWIYDPLAPDRRWSGPLRLSQARALHTATWFAGADGDPDTDDDFVLLVGGWNGQKEVNILDMIRPNGAVPEISIFPSNPHPTPRFLHTAHPIPEESRLVLVGGHSRWTALNRECELIEFDYGPAGDPGDAIVRPLGSLQHARREHASALVRSELGWLLLVFGGYGDTGQIRSAEVEVVDVRAQVLARPEVLPIDLREPGRRESVLLPDPGIGPRRGCRLVPLREEGFPWLLVGGTDRSHEPGYEPGERCRAVYRLSLAATGSSLADPRASFELEIRPAGSLGEPRSAPQVALLEDGRVLIAGGTRGIERSALAELYNPLLGEFGAVEALCRDLTVARGEPYPRWGDFSISRTLDDGERGGARYLIVGGAGSDLAGCELFLAEE